MKKSVAFLRFGLVLIGSFFLALGILIINGCRSGSGRAKAPPPPPKEPGAVRTNEPRAIVLTEWTADQLIAGLDHADFPMREAAQQALIRRGQDIVPRVGAAATNDNPEIRTRALAILAVLGWHLTREGRLEKMSESPEFRKMMRHRLPEMPAE
jgi:hypothetical protein